MTAERDARILALYSDGIKIKDIAAEVGMAANSVGQALKRLGVDRPSKPQKKWAKSPDDQSLIDDYAAGLSTSQIADKRGCPQSSVAATLRRCGVDLSERRQRYDGDGNAVIRGGGLQRIASRA